ncbi:MAG: Gfo/Idh/MocA family protein [Dehalococcoidia bacterium]
MAQVRRVAATEVSHWHSTYDASYLRILSNLDVEIVGVSDRDAAIAKERADKFGSTAFTDYRDMIEKTKPEFVIALGRHVDMPEIFRFLVDTGIPFVMEKPWGIDAETVSELADLAESKGAWVAVPFMNRYSHWAITAKEMMAAGEFGAVSHVVFRMIRPTMERYRLWDSPWMMSREAAGGGALINLGGHGMDIARFITGEEVAVVSAVISNSIHRAEVEDYALATLRTPSGIIFHNEVGYTMPTWPANRTDSEQKVAGEKAILRLVPEGLQIVAPNRDQIIPTPPNYEGGHQRVIRECLERVANGQPPPITARDCAKAVSLIHDAYRLAGRD